MNKQIVDTAELRFIVNALRQLYHSIDDTECSAILGKSRDELREFIDDLADRCRNFS